MPAQKPKTATIFLTRTGTQKSQRETSSTLNDLILMANDKLLKLTNNRIENRCFQGRKEPSISITNNHCKWVRGRHSERNMGKEPEQASHRQRNANLWGSSSKDPKLTRAQGDRRQGTKVPSQVGRPLTPTAEGACWGQGP